MSESKVEAQTNGASVAFSDEPTLVLLFGMPRSGTTWFGKLFDSHPKVAYRHEPDSVFRLRMPLYPYADCSAESREDLESFVARLANTRVLRVLGKRPFFPKSNASMPRHVLHRAAIEVARVGSRVVPDFPVLIRSAPGRSRAEPVIVWKSIESLGRLGQILGYQSQAKAIHIVRHPCGFVASVLRGIAKNSFTQSEADVETYGIVSQMLGTPVCERYGFDKGFQGYLYSLSVEERLAWRWVLVNDKAWFDASNDPRYRCVRYEDMCRDPNGKLETLFDFAGLDMNPQTRQFIRASTRDTGGGYYSVFKSPEAAAWQWHRELDPETIDRVAAIAARSRIAHLYRNSLPSVRLA